MSYTSSPACKRCGICCMANMLSFVKEEDMVRWKAGGRTDILHIIDDYHPIWAGDHLISSQDGHHLYSCPFLEINGNECICSIYETRPHVCRDFVPGSTEICPLWHR